MNTVPGGGSCSRGSRLISVDLPEPVAPTSATVWPGSMRERRRPAAPDGRSPIRERQVAELDRAREIDAAGRPAVAVGVG